MQSGYQATNHLRNIAILIAVIIVSGLSVSLYMYSADRFSLLYYGDSVSHLIAARKLFDWSENPGWAQLGTVWLPLPHFLLMFPSMIDSLFFSGFAGLAISLPSLALTSIFIYKMVVRLLSGVLPGNASERIIPYSAFTGALLYGLNPNFIYLGITAMTEAPFMLFFVASSYYLLKWLDLDIRIDKVPKQDVNNILIASIFASAASLCRYEGWVLPLFIVVAAILSYSIPHRTKRVFRAFEPANSYQRSVNLGKNSKNIGDAVDEPINRTRTRQMLLLIILASFVSFSGIAFWLIYNKVTYGSALEFESAQYYSAASQALSRPFREALFLQPLNTLHIYGTTALIIYGPIILATAIVGFFLYFRLYRKRKSEDEAKPVSRRSLLLLLYLAFPPIFTLITLLIGIGEMSFWFNSRFIILLAPLLVVLAAIFMARQPERVVQKKALLFGIIASLFVFQLAMPTFSTVVTLLDAKTGFEYGQAPYTAAVGGKIRELYNGNGSIMIMTGSAQEHRILISSGIQLRNYDSIIDSSTWKKSFYEPWNYGDRFIILGKEPDSDAGNVIKYWKENRIVLQEHYHPVFDNKYYEILMQN